MATFSKFINNLQPSKILVFGDFMLDNYIVGKVERISPEAPIPILLVEDEILQLGGAGCCIANLVELGFQPVAMGIYGKDEAGNKLLNLFKKKKLATNKLVCVDDYQTVVKCRLLTNKQQLLRVDYEKKYVNSKKIISKIMANLDDLDSFSSVILSDYGKGICDPVLVQEIIQKVKKNDIFTMVDPAKGVDFSIYKEASCIKPNRLETEIFCKFKLNNLQDYIKAASFIQQKTAIGIIALSLDKEGLFIYENFKKYKLFNTKKETVFDVTGAGDLVTSILSIAIPKGSVEIAGELANLATAVSIKKLGAYNPSWEEIKEQKKLYS